MKSFLSNIQEVSWGYRHPGNKIEIITLSWCNEKGDGLFNDIIIYTQEISVMHYRIKPYIPRGIIIETKGKTKTKESLIDNHCMIQRIIITNDEIFWSKYPIEQRYIGAGNYITALIEYKDKCITKGNEDEIIKNLLKGRYGG